MSAAEQPRFAVIGGTGRIGTHVVRALRAAGHHALPHARSTGVDVLTGEGLTEALAGVDVVIDVSQAPTADDTASAFFRTASGNLLDAAGRGGVRHVVLLSVVGVDRVPDLGYYRAKTVQEELFKAGPLPCSIVRATQFFEFVDEIMSWTTEGDTVRLPTTAMQPVAAVDVARALADVAAGVALNATRDIAGPEVFPLDELGRITLAARGERRAVVTDHSAGPFALVPGRSVVADGRAHIAPTRYREWLALR